VASDILEPNRDRKNRKNAEKINIRVEGSFLEEGDGRRNRIAASSAKCKENKARWNFYQGQPSVVFQTTPPTAPKKYSSGRAELPATASDRPPRSGPMFRHRSDCVRIET
jgi:hypothetical protein